MMQARIRQHGFALVLRSAETLDAQVLQAARTGMARGLQFAVTTVQREFLSGPRPERLDVRTTRLRNSITSEAEITGNQVKGVVGTNVKYAAWHEFGFRGAVNVRAHNRVAKIMNQLGATVDKRRILRDRRKQVIGFRDTLKDVARDRKAGLVHFISVRAHTRNVNYKGRPFLRPGVEKALPLVIREIKKELAKLPQQGGQA